MLGMKEPILRTVDLALFWFDVVSGSAKGCRGSGPGDLAGDAVN